MSDLLSSNPQDTPLQFVMVTGVPCMENERIGRPATVMECAAEIQKLTRERDEAKRHQLENLRVIGEVAIERDTLRAQRDGYRGAVERLNALLERRQKPERPVAWYRWAESDQRVPAPIFAWGNWPPPEPDDTAWYPLYSTPEGRLADETFDVTNVTK